MKMKLRIDILTLFPQMFSGITQSGFWTGIKSLEYEEVQLNQYSSD
jgi:tRNA G37 N-methylase TrmD